MYDSFLELAKNRKTTYGFSNKKVVQSKVKKILEAEDLDISSFIITAEQKIVNKLPKINKKDMVPLIIGLGYDKKDSFEPERERFLLSTMTSYEFFGGKK